jgi:hypothetical protein
MRTVKNTLTCENSTLRISAYLLVAYADIAEWLNDAAGEPMITILPVG